MKSTTDQVTDLYRCFDKDGNLLYVGISFSAMVRSEQHKESADWFSSLRTMTVEKHESRKLALQAEYDAIAMENPKHNKQHNKPREDSDNDVPYVNIGIPIELRNNIKFLAKRVERRSMISYLESVIAEEMKRAVKEDKLKSEGDEK